MDATELRAWREARKRTQAQLARLLHVTQRSVKRWESGACALPPFLDLALLGLEVSGTVGHGTVGQSFKASVAERRKTAINEDSHQRGSVRTFRTVTGEAPDPHAAIELVMRWTEEGDLDEQRETLDALKRGLVDHIASYITPSPCLCSQYSRLSASASQDASMMSVELPTVRQMWTPSVDSIKTRTDAIVPVVPSRMRTL